MPRPYSLDLRTKAIAFLDDGMPIKMIAENLGVHRASVHAWVKLYKAGESIEAKKFGRKFHVWRKVSEEDFKAYVEKNPGKTGAEMGKDLGISKNCVSINMRRIGYVFKKKRFQTLDKMKKKEKNSNK